jgi:hypothetical protein
MIDFEAIPKRVCLDRKLQDEFLKDPVKVTEQLLNENCVTLTGEFRELCAAPYENLVPEGPH